MNRTIGAIAADAFPVAMSDGRSITAIHYRAARAPEASTPAAAADAAIILAHGAGAGQLSPFMVGCATALATYGLDAVTFNFPYMEQKRRLPDRAPVLEACYAAVIGETRQRLASARRGLFIGGKSMGGRIATQLAASDRTLPVAGLVLLGYPLHPPGRPNQRRDAHLASVHRPRLFVQGSRDAFGTPAELEPALAPLASSVTLHVVDGGDHSFALSRATAEQRRAVDDAIPEVVARWIHDHARG